MGVKAGSLGCFAGSGFGCWRRPEFDEAEEDENEDEEEVEKNEGEAAEREEDGGNEPVWAVKCRASEEAESRGAGGKSEGIACLYCVLGVCTAGLSSEERLVTCVTNRRELIFSSKKKK